MACVVFRIGKAPLQDHDYGAAIYPEGAGLKQTIIGRHYPIFCGHAFGRRVTYGVNAVKPVAPRGC